MNGKSRPKVVLGVCSSISLYKSCEILRGLQKHGCDVRIVMTGNAARLVSPRLFAALSGSEVETDLWKDPDSPRIVHIELAGWADLLLVAPATANTIAGFASGSADDLLSTLYLAVTGPVAVAPAMNENMYRHARTRANLTRLEEDGVTVIQPEAGYLACGEEGPGRLADPKEIIKTALALLEGSKTLKDRRVLVTAGPTREFLDPVRFLTSRSSGRMGYELAGEALRRGANVTLISGPCHLAPPAGVELITVGSAEEMRRSVLEVYSRVDIVVMAAAVSDFTFERTSPEKLKKGTGEKNIRLVPAPDILQELGRCKGERFLVGFAAETEHLERNARDKAINKNLDLIVANDVSREGIGFDSPENQVLILPREGAGRTTPVAGKREISRLIWDEIEERFGGTDE